MTYRGFATSTTSSLGRAEKVILLHTLTTMSLSSFFSSFIPTVYFDAPEDNQEEKPEADSTADKAEPEQEQAEEEAEEPEDVCARSFTSFWIVLTRRCILLLDLARSPGGMHGVLQVRSPHQTFPALRGENPGGKGIQG